MGIKSNPGRISSIKTIIEAITPAMTINADATIIRRPFSFRKERFRSGVESCSINAVGINKHMKETVAQLYAFEY